MSKIHEITVADHPGLVQRFAQMSKPPTTLWARGSVDLLHQGVNNVAVLGSRASTAYGEEQASRFALGFTQALRNVVTGLPYGIETAATRAVVSVDGTPIVVLACGVDVPYPRANHNLLDRVVQTGVAVSAYPPGTPPNRERFIERGALIAALVTDVVVIEAGAHSSSLHAAKRARAQGRRVWAMPGPVTSMQSQGCHKLIAEGTAQIITDPEDLS